MATDLSNYQGGGAIRLGGMVAGVYGAFRESKEKEEALARQKAEKEEKQQQIFTTQLAETMAKVPTKGLQQQDIPGFQKLFSEMEDAYVRAASTTDNSQRLLERAKLKELATKATLYTQRSEALGKKRTEHLKTLETGYDKFDAEVALKSLNEFYDRPLDQINSDFPVLQFRHKWDSSKLDKTLDDVRKSILDSSPNVTPRDAVVESVQNGFDRVNTIRTTRVIPKEDAVTSFKSRYSTDTNFKRYVDTEFDGTLDTKLGQLYDNLSAANWNTEIKDSTRVQGRAPRTSGGSGGSDSDSSAGVNTNVDIAFATNNTVTAAKQTALKGNGMKARLGKNVRAYDLNTGDPLQVTSGMQDGTIQEFVQLPTGDIKGGGQRILVKGTENRFGKDVKMEDFAVVRYRKPLYVLSDERETVYTGTGADLQKAIRSKAVVQSGYEDVSGLFPMDAVLPSPESMTKGERATVSEYKNTRTTRPSTTPRSKVLDALR